MTRNYAQVPPNAGASDSGPTYEPQVTPWNRDTDTTGVTETKPGEDYDSEGKPRDPKAVRDKNDKVWNDKGLTPTYTEDVGEKS
jgi:hypothetical protein